jgi:site-specific recombinase XerD
VSLADARQTARDTLTEAQAGVDAAREKVEGRRAETFADLAEEYIKHHASEKRTGKKPHVPLVTRWGALRAKDITRRDVRELTDDVADRAPVMANRTLALVRKVFNFAIERDWLETNPCHMVKAPTKEHARDRVLTGCRCGPEAGLRIGAR